jgi:hypothetical protein
VSNQIQFRVEYDVKLAILIRTTDRSWIRISNANSVLFSETLQVGETESQEVVVTEVVEEIKIRIGNLPQTEIQLNGVPLRLDDFGPLPQTVEVMLDIQKRL